MSKKKWSIGLYHGDTPFSLKPIKQNPVIHAQSVRDISADFVADPFMLCVKGTWFMFFETLPNADATNNQENLPKGVIGCSKSDDGISWTYLGTVLQEQYHLSYPHVFESNGEIYMLPETLGANNIRLYKADKFPYQWRAVNNLLNGQHADATPFHYQQKWWMYSCPAPDKHNALELHYADNLQGPWFAHPDNPIIENDCRTARPAGRVTQWQGRLYRFAQDCSPRYGTQVRVFEVTTLSKDKYQEYECPQSPIMRPSGKGWNGRNMHHIDLHTLPDGTWFACTDGYYLD